MQQLITSYNLQQKKKIEHNQEQETASLSSTQAGENNHSHGVNIAVSVLVRKEIFV